MRQLYGKLYNLNKDEEFANTDNSENINDLIIDNEKAVEIATLSILEMTEKYKDYIKISRFVPIKN